MGIRVSAAIVATSFLLGILCTHWIADSLTLWKPPLTEARIREAVMYYDLYASFPPWMTWSIVGVATAGAASLLASFREGEAGNIMFDGASLFLYGCTIVVYLTAVLPNLSEISALKHLLLGEEDLPPSLRQPTIELATSHLICSVALTGVLVMQAGRAWAKAEDMEEDASVAAEQAAEQARRSNSKEGARGRRSSDAADEGSLSPETPVRKSTRRRDPSRSALGGSGSSRSKIRRQS